MSKSPRHDETGFAFRGSQRQIQLYVNQQAALLSQSIIVSNATIPLNAKIEWVSPLQKERYREYWDGAFLDALGLGAFRQELADFWPKRGPHWDALAKVEHAGKLDPRT